MSSRPSQLDTEPMPLSWHKTLALGYFWALPFHCVSRVKPLKILQAADPTLSCPLGMGLPSPQAVLPALLPAAEGPHLLIYPLQLLPCPRDVKSFLSLL